MNLQDEKIKMERCIAGPDIRIKGSCSDTQFCLYFYIKAYGIVGFV